MDGVLIGGRYLIKSLIGEGGMASVYAALDQKLDRKVAIKILHPHLARNNDIRERFLLEAKTVSTLEHPNIIKVYDFSGLDSEQLWMVTEILYGVDLAEFVKKFHKSRLHPVIASLIACEVCRALNEVHKLRIVHRDIKPENIMMLDTGLVKLMDFGIAKVHRANATQTGTFMGSPSYMSPEQIRGADVDVRADIYSLAVLFYEIVTGVLPYLGHTTAEVINKIMVGRYIPPINVVAEISLALNDVIVRGMQSTKEQRFQDITQMLQALEQIIKNYGFGESRLELENFAKNPSEFEKRLGMIPIIKQQVKHPTQSNLKDTVPLGKMGANPFSVKPNLSAQSDVSQQDTIPLNSGKAFKADPDPKIKSPSKIAGPQPVQASVAPQKDQRKDPPPASSKGNPRAQGTGQQTTPPQKTPNSDAKHTQGPRTNFTNNPRPQSQQKAYIREMSGVELRKFRKSSQNWPMIFGLAAALTLVVFVLGDRLGEKPKEALKPSQGQSPEELVAASKKVKPDNPAGTPTTKEDPAVAPPTQANQGADDVQTQVDSQTVALDNSGKTPPRITQRESLDPRNNRPVRSPSPLPNRTGVQQPNKAQGSDRPNQVPKDISLAGLSPDKASTNDPIPSDPPPSESTKGPGLLRIAALPAAEIFVDGKLMGTTNDRTINTQGIRLDAGSYEVKIQRRGYKTEEQNVELKSGETREINVTLQKTIELIDLTIRINRIPSNLVIEDLRDGGRRKEETLNRNNTTFKLKPGSYRVVVSHQSEVKNRVIDLRESDRSITFNAEFK